MEKEYTIEIDARILELLGPNLYTNIYYVLAELIANAYDADAHNVYIISEENAIRVEDDGKGMSYKEGGISKYLGVAKLSRTDEYDSVTALGRKKMGRKGIGKLAALSVSENVDIMTVTNGEKPGFVLSRHPGQGGMLTPIDDDAVSFQKVHNHGTAIVMCNPEYSLHKTTDAIKRNIVNIFPLIDADFRIHIINPDQKDVVIERLDDVFAKSLCSIITLGDDYKYLSTKVKTKFLDKQDRLIEARGAYTKNLRMKNNNGEEKEYMLTIEEWIGAYESTRGRKKNSSDFPDNFISLPQTRKRLVLLASRFGEIKLIPPTIMNPKDYKTVRQTISELPPIVAGGTCLHDSLHRASALTPLNLQRIRATKEGGSWKEWPDELKLQCHKNEAGRSFGSVYGRMKWDEPSPTMTTQCTGYGNGRFGHSEQDRAISAREAALLQTFPMSYRFFKDEEHVSLTKASRYIGNAVPPVLGEVVAQSILNHLRQCY